MESSTRILCLLEPVDLLVGGGRRLSAAGPRLLQRDEDWGTAHIAESLIIKN